MTAVFISFAMIRIRMSGNWYFINPIPSKTAEKSRTPMLRIHIASIAEKEWNIDEQVDISLLPLLAGVSRDGSTTFTCPVHARIRATWSGESILIDGHVQTAARLICSRCLEPFEHAIDIVFSATAIAENEASADHRLTDDIELSADEMDVIFYGGDSIDLSEEIAQQIIMALPYKPLCQDTCKGLCSHCGINLNHHTCQCDDQDQSNPFAFLKTLRLPPKKD